MDLASLTTDVHSVVSKAPVPHILTPIFLKSILLITGAFTDSNAESNTSCPELKMQNSLIVDCKTKVALSILWANFIPAVLTKNTFLSALTFEQTEGSSCRIHLSTGKLPIISFFLSFFLSPASVYLTSLRVEGYYSFDHTQWHTTVGRAPPDEGSARHKDLYLTTHNTYNRQTSMAPAGFEPATPAGEWLQTHALDRSATGIGTNYS